MDRLLRSVIGTRIPPCSNMRFRILNRRKIQVLFPLRNFSQMKSGWAVDKGMESLEVIVEYNGQ